MQTHYFDHNATTPIAPEVAETMVEALRHTYGNASSVHAAGQVSRQKLEASRRTIAQFLNASPTELVFTSGGTEADNLALLGLVRNIPGTRKHVITTMIEHPAVLEPCRQLEREGVDVTYVEVSGQGIVDPEEIQRQLRPETVLVSVMHANNEVGTLQPIAEIAEIVHRQNTYLHSDGVQAFGKTPVDVKALGVDLYSLSAHKIFGPKGIGALVVRKGVPLRGILHGGRHERERRPGTENVPAAIAFTRAVELCRERETRDAAHVSSIRDLFEARVLDLLDGVEVNGSAQRRLGNTSNLLFHGVSGEALVIALDMRGMAVSSGAACSSGSTEPSHVLLAMGRSKDEASASVRFSFGRYNTRDEAEELASAVATSVRQLRKTARQEARLVTA